ncbi:MAG: hypothetical protein PHG65_03140 [Kiritimatiellae bacterium]|nr:hypothetical protein [Kiritimatiellia bacterium]
MAESRAHNVLANRLAKKHGTEYNKGAGADIKASKMVIEVETEQTIGDASRQLQGYQRPVYVATTTQSAAQAALEHYDGTSIGVMDPFGRILKRSTRG